jgi:predicted KAP-like P-loop ATPase
MENIMALIVAFILLMTLGIQIQIRNLDKKIDEVLKKIP